MSEPAPISAILPAYDRPDATRATVARIAACDPPPAEIIVHLDGGKDFAIPGATKILHSKTSIGPGGGRNRLLSEASSPYVASFDDDSYPVSPDFFAHAASAIATYPGYALYALEIQHPDPSHDFPLPGGDTPHETTLFQGCGCIYQRSHFLTTEGYIALPCAYGMEEIDLALRLHAKGGRIVTLPGLPVFHDADLTHHASPAITAASLANQALFTYLRYPVRALPIGIVQYLRKALDQIMRGRISGTFRGIKETPAQILRFAKLRKPVPLAALQDFRRVTRHPIAAPHHG